MYIYNLPDSPDCVLLLYAAAQHLPVWGIEPLKISRTGNIYTVELDTELTNEQEEHLQLTRVL